MNRKITFSRLGKYGRLGNQLYQIAGVMGLAEKHGLDPVFPRWRYQRYFAPIPEGRAGQCLPVREKQFEHHEWQIPSRGNIDISGYLQSEKNFSNIQCPIAFRKGFLRLVREKNEGVLSKPSLGIHIRRGDYVGNKNYTQLTIGYFITAMQKHFPDWQDRNIVIFSDDLDYCRVHFGCLPNVTYTDKMSDVECMALMSMMDGLIISNSSFSWWGAWFAEKHGAKIVRPDRCFEGTLANNSIRDLYPERWISHPHDEKIDLTDCTFTIPVAYDHKDREENLNLCLKHLGRDIVTNIVIMEQSKRTILKFERFRGFKDVLAVQHFQSSLFHRTRMLNIMAEQAKTPIVANWDADVLVPPLQILLSCMAIRNGVDMVYPYGGIFARIPRRIWLKKIQQHDIGIVKSTVFPGMTEGFESVGGAVLFNRKAFLEYGGENEKFISYGAEDVERAYRFPAMGCSMIRIPGALYHMDHFVGVNSSKRNPHFQSNEAEWNRVRQLSSDELKKVFYKGG